MLRRLSLLATLALLLSLAAAAPAHADFIDTLNGHDYDFFTKGQSTATHADDNGNCFIVIAADLHRRFDSPDDEAAFAVRPVGRVSKGDCAVRVQIDKLRAGSEGGSHVVDDCRISIAGRTPCAPRNSGPLDSAYGEGDWLTEFAPGLGTDSLALLVRDPRVRVRQVVRRPARALLAAIVLYALRCASLRRRCDLSARSFSVDSRSRRPGQRGQRFVPGVPPASRCLLPFGRFLRPVAAARVGDDPPRGIEQVVLGFFGAARHAYAFPLPLHRSHR